MRPLQAHTSLAKAKAKAKANKNGIIQCFVAKVLLLQGGPCHKKT